MTEATTNSVALTISIDQGDCKSHVCVLEADREMAEEGLLMERCGNST